MTEYDSSIVFDRFRQRADTVMATNSGHRPGEMRDSFACII